jgi:hypothetical protein
MEAELRQKLIEYLAQKGIPRTIEPQNPYAYKREIPYVGLICENPVSLALAIFKPWVDELMSLVGWSVFHDLRIVVDHRRQILVAMISQGVI